MAKKAFFDELERALARPDAGKLTQQLDAYAAYYAATDGNGEWPEDHIEDFIEIQDCYRDDPEKALAYVTLAAARSDDAGFLALLGCGPLENLLGAPSEELIERVVAQARKSARFRWLLSHPFKVAVSASAWQAIEKFRVAGSHEEPSLDELPPRD